MIIAFSWWLIATIIGYMICFVAALFVHDVMRSSTTVARISGAVIGFIVCATIGNLIYWGASTSSKNLNTTAVSNTVVAEQLFNFKTDTEYPLIQNEQVETIRGTTEAQNGVFSSATVVEMYGGPAIMVMFTHGDTTYPLSVPLISTPIIVDDEKTPTMLVRFRPGPWNYRTDAPNTLASTGAYYPHIWSDCNLILANFAAACQRIETVAYQNLVVAKEVREAGLGRLIEVSSGSASLTITSAMYDELFGKKA